MSSSRGKIRAVYLPVSTAERATNDQVSLGVRREQCLASVERSGWEIIGGDLTGDVPFLGVHSGLDTEKRA